MLSWNWCHTCLNYSEGKPGTCLRRGYKVTRLLLCVSVCGLLLAQQEKQPPTTIRTTVENVLAPVTVFDRNNNYVHGLTPDQFRIYDNGKEQNIHQVEVTYTPISLVMAIQANARADKILPQVNKIGTMLKPIMLGDQGEAAVVAFDSRVRTLQDFTPDADKITKAIKSIYAGSLSSRLVDAVEESVRMLKTRNKDRRRILLVIGESRDYGSEARGRETLIELQLANITAYWVDMSHLLGTLTTPTPDPRPDNAPPASHPLPGGVPSTPTTVQQMYGTNGSQRRVHTADGRDLQRREEHLQDQPGGIIHARDGRQRTVAVVHVPIHNQHALQAMPALRIPRGDSQVIEEAESHPAAGDGMMAGRPHRAEGVARLTRDHGVDGLQHAARRLRRDVPGIRRDVGIAGAQPRASESTSCFAVRRYSGVWHRSNSSSVAARRSTRASRSSRPACRNPRTTASNRSGRSDVAPRQVLAENRVGQQRGSRFHEE